MALPYGLARNVTRWMWKAGIAKQLHPGWVETLRYPAIMDKTKAREELNVRPEINRSRSGDEAPRSQGATTRNTGSISRRCNAASGDASAPERLFISGRTLSREPRLDTRETFRAFIRSI